MLIRNQRSYLPIIGVALLIFVLSSIIQIGVDPHYEGMTTDSGVFAYCGNQILAGRLLYRDCLDNKPPAIYYLNAAAIMLGGATPWAVWIFHAIWIAITFILFFFIQARIWSGFPAFCASILFCLTVLFPSYYIGGNFTETYALLPIILCIGCLFQYLLKAKWGYLAGIGLTAASAILLKPTYLGIAVTSIFTVIFLDMMRKNYKALLNHLLVIVTTFCVPLILVAAYWLFNNSLYDLIFAVFWHNQDYIQESLSIRSLGSTVKMYLVYQPLASLTILAGFTLAGYLYEIFFRLVSPKTRQFEPALYVPRKMGEVNAQTWLVAAVGCSIIIDFIMIAISGKNFGHYFVIALPGLTTVCAFLFHKLERLSDEKGKKTFHLAALLVAITMLTLSWALEIAPAEIPRSEYLKQFFTGKAFIHQANDLEKYILDHSSPDQSVLVWGLRPDLNFTTGRRSPSRFIFLPHLFSPTSQGSNGFDEFLRHLGTDPPEVIVVDITDGRLPFFGAAGDDRCPGCSPDAKEGMDKLNLFVEQNYIPDGQVYDWLVYLHK